MMAARSAVAPAPTRRKIGPFQRARTPLGLAVVNTLREPLLILDSGLRVTYANAAYYEALAEEENNIEGQELCRLAPWRRLGLQRLLRQILIADKELCDYEVEAEFPRVGQRSLLLDASRIRGERRRARLILLALEDVTARRAAERALQDQLAALQQSNADLEQFALAAAHDLQEPLRMIGSFTELLAKEHRGKLGTESDESIAYIVDGVKRMQALVGDLLAYARLAARPPEFQDIDSEKILLDTLDDLEMCVAEAGATVTHAPLPRLWADPSQLHELLQNLVANAIKFRGATPPAVHVSARRSPGFWVFSVRDNGIGIPLEFQEAIFGAFKRLHSRAKFEGTGMGLAICRKIAERHGGRIWVESDLGQGSTFYFTVPAAEKG